MNDVIAHLIFKISNKSDSKLVHFYSIFSINLINDLFISTKFEIYFLMISIVFKKNFISVLSFEIEKRVIFFIQSSTMITRLFI